MYFPQMGAESFFVTLACPWVDWNGISLIEDTGAMGIIMSEADMIRVEVAMA